MSTRELVDSLLYEGYALYPYTPGATKNATPTPFGIVYPPAYAADCAGTFDYARLECLTAPGCAGARFSVTLRYLAASGPRHEAAERRVALSDLPAAERRTVEFADGRLTLRSEPAPDGSLRVRCCVHNERPVPHGLTRTEALRHSLMSVQLLLETSVGRFISPLDAEARSLNTYPVLVGERDEAILGTTIMLPDHPSLAPESLGGLFDSTEIEEALLLHVKALSEDEREEIAAADPAVAEMIARAETATPEQIIALHGRITLRDPREGEPEATVDGVRFVRGAHVLLRPGPDADLHARLLDGRTATIERILVDVDGKVHLGVTIDGDPGQDLLRETGRLLFFFAPEVEVI
ncbi:MAG TPA: hypothetical protein VFP55_00905 [Solirubrobacteraceae bacterium]|nr:hypothetical protein [Solirubrobacteraceae bacterium]